MKNKDTIYAIVTLYQFAYNKIEDYIVAQEYMMDNDWFIVSDEKHIDEYTIFEKEI